ncbi:hypothetical protein CP082626L3_1022A, partial [Chlamydia psittaci 08-2626_L3]
MYVTTPHYKR